MKTKFLLTVLFSIGIIGITSAQGFASNDRKPVRVEMVKTHGGIQSAHKVKRHHHRKVRRVVRKHHVMRHQERKHF
jgi:hypothetical protein